MLRHTACVGVRLWRKLVNAMTYSGKCAECHLVKPGSLTKERFLYVSFCSDWNIFGLSLVINIYLLDIILLGLFVKSNL